MEMYVKRAGEAPSYLNTVQGKTRRNRSSRQVFSDLTSYKNTINLGFKGPFSEYTKCYSISQLVESLQYFSFGKM